MSVFRKCRRAARSSRDMSARAVLLWLLAACAGCGGPRYAGGYNGPRGYDGNGDYGYDRAASRAEARGYRVRAARAYPAPGRADDPWGPYIRQAAARYRVPERWVREVMRQESGGRQQSADGTLTISGAGAMGLMQVMPGTYDILRQRYGLGDDPYLPQDNILAGTAYIREMYDRFGSPGFLAAYNAGPDRLDAYLTGGAELPDETVNYVASVAPRLGTEVAMSGPLSMFADAAGASAIAGASSDDGDPANKAFDGGGLVTADAPTGVLTGQAPAAGGGWRGDGSGARPAMATVATVVPVTIVPVTIAPVTVGRVTGAPITATPVTATSVTARPASALLPLTAPGTRVEGWAVQVGAFPNPAVSEEAVLAARARAGPELTGSRSTITPVQRGGTLYRARLVGLTADRALAACTRLQRQGLVCFTVSPGS